MANISVFDVIGPNMVGPSSSHTAGAAAIALLAGKMAGGPIRQVTFTLYGSFAKTYRGHGTDRALVGGILGFETDDLRIRSAFELAREQGLAFAFQINEEETDIHPNSVDIQMDMADGGRLTVRGVSLGGGKMKITRLNGINVDFTGEYCTLIVRQYDEPGVVAHITNCLSACRVNIAFMRLFREGKGKIAYTIVESDHDISDEIKHQISIHKDILDVVVVHK